MNATNHRVAASDFTISKRPDRRLGATFCYRCTMSISGYVPQERVNEMLSLQAASNANITRNATEELRQELHDLSIVLAAIVMSNGGELYAGDRELYEAKDANLESWKDERNRRWVFRCEASR